MSDISQSNPEQLACLAADCQQFEDRLNECFDQRQRWQDDWQLEGHARECQRCHDAALDLARVVWIVERRPVARGRADLASRVLGELLAPRSLPAAPSPAAWMSSFAAIAAVILIAVVGLAVRPPQPESDPAAVASRATGAARLAARGHRQGTLPGEASTKHASKQNFDELLTLVIGPRETARAASSAPGGTAALARDSFETIQQTSAAAWEGLFESLAATEGPTP